MIRRTFRRPPPKRPQATIDMTSLIDLTFLLLVTFIITLPAMEMGVSLVLPKAKAEELPLREKNVRTVSIDSQGRIFLDGEEYSLPELERKMQALAAEDPDTPVLVKGDETRPYGEIAKVMALLHRCRIHRMSMVTQNE